MKRKKTRRSLIMALVMSILIAVPTCAYAQSSSAETGGYLTMPRSKFNFIFPETTEVITEIVPKYDDSGDITTTTTPTEKDDDGTNKVKEENQRELIKQANLYDSDVVVIKPAEDDDDISTKIPGSLLEEISKRPGLDLSINTLVGKVVIDTDGVLDLAEKAGQDDIVVTIIRDDNPTGKEKEIAGKDGIVYRVIITIGGKEIETINGTITLLLNADDPLLDKEIIAIHLKDGREKEIANNRYDKDGGNWITVKTSSAGTYILTHKDKVKEDVTKPEKPNNGSNQGEIKPTEGGQDNQPGSTPQTGDDFALLKYLLILFAAGTLLAAARKLDK
ncbi:hypothetical protein D1155_11535 [Anaerotruncus sp. 80]|uniref:Gram-positive cocci surface proteins LPxTG domain-containing protein n=1 Tax=Anaerotruncus colihominis TaxID=169435 RepID=A0A845QJC2_9FIRM|nr:MULTISPECIES: hypothetical protein [Anaerotruncus]NBH62282.1 hypothetical protein [Anaerotruncus colihominis]NCF02937.1 hypothetical protein [Anaerotruncus sp. 80]